MNDTSTNQHLTEFKSGFVAITGAPNVGKSTLFNRMLSDKVSITSKKPQTTRNRILGIVNRPVSQLIFIDTPGIHKARSILNMHIVDVALSALGDVDLILWVADVTHPDPQSETMLLKKLVKLKKPVILALNKIDLEEKQRLLSAIDTWAKSFYFQDIIPVSAKNNIQVENILEAIEVALPNAHPFFPTEVITDKPERFIAAEMIREKIFRFTGQEIPYAIAVTVDSFSENNTDNLVKIDASIHVERNSQKGIIIGKKGSKLKKIGEAARKDIERMVGTRVFLKLFVRVQKNWSKDTKSLRRFGY